MTPTTRAGWLFAAGVLVVELGFIGTHPTRAKAVARSIYVTIWKVLPKPDGVDIPDRFK